MQLYVTICLCGREVLSESLRCHRILPRHFSFDENETASTKPVSSFKRDTKATNTNSPQKFKYRLTSGEHDSGLNHFIGGTYARFVARTFFAITLILETVVPIRLTVAIFYEIPP